MKIVSLLELKLKYINNSKSKIKKKIWINYWNERQKSVKDLDSKGAAVFAAYELLKSIAIESRDTIRVIELGCGTGHLIGELQKICAEANTFVTEYVGVDYHGEAISNARKLYQDINFLEANFAEQPLNLGKFDVVLLVNTLHEVYSSCFSTNMQQIDDRAGKEHVKKVLNDVTNLIKDEGYIILFDGVESSLPDEQMIAIKFRSEDAFIEFKKIVDEYEAIPIKYIETGIRNSVRISFRNFTRYLTEIKFCNSDLWEIEKRESYQYFTENEFTKYLNQLGFKIINLRFLSPDLEIWRSRVSLEISNIDFPQKHILIIGKYYDLIHQDIPLEIVNLS